MEETEMIRTVRLWAIYCPESKRILYHAPIRKLLHKNVSGCVVLKLTATYAKRSIKP